ncbi:MAG: amino acid ABC transporter substrate-binding protein, partial [Betaproteobacteria bacterium]
MNAPSSRRRQILLGASALPLVATVGSTRAAPSGPPVVIGLPLARSGPAGVADHQDHWNGAMLAVEEI